MHSIARFEKVSLSQFKEAMLNLPVSSLPTSNCLAAYSGAWNDLALPTRATAGSAGYDFHIPYDLCVQAGREYLVPTGIRAQIKPGWFLLCVPKSGLGFKKGMRLSNTCGIVDSDYYHSDHEGHIFLKFSMERDHVFAAGDKIMQAIFLPFGVTTNDTATGARNGGFGSTGE